MAMDQILQTYGLRWFDDRNPTHLLAAVRYCEQTRQPPPFWLPRLLATAQPQLSPGDIRDFIRYSWVQHGTKHRLTTWTDRACYTWAAAQNGEQISGETVRKSYRRVNATIRSGLRWRYPQVVILEGDWGTDVVP
jgi:hypothetical protein